MNRYLMKSVASLMGPHKIPSWMEAALPRSFNTYMAMLNFYSQFIQKGDLCFDVGANLGNRTEVLLGLGGTVVCVEPQDACVHELRKLFRDNSNVTIVPKALGEREGFGELEICEEEPTISTMSDKWKNDGRFANSYKWRQKQTVSITTLDTLIRTHGIPKFCKIDVEGFEERVLKGLTVPIPFISFEFTREFFDDTKKCIAHLLSIGRACFNCSIGESMKLLFPQWVTPDMMYEKLDSFEDRLLWGDVYVRFC